MSPRVALCISGQPRNIRDTFPYIYNHIILPNNADVFFHTYFDPQNTVLEKTHIGRGDCSVDPNVVDELVQLYKPVRYAVEKPRNFERTSLYVPENRIRMSRELNPQTNWDRDQHKKHVLKNMMSMYYSMFKANELKELYSYETGIQYDYVIRARFDLVPLQPILCNTLDPTKLHFHDLGQPEGQMCDWFNIGSNSVMNIFTSVFHSMEYLNSYTYFSRDDRQPNLVEGQEGGGFNEYLTRDIIHLHKIPTQAHNFQVILHPRN